LCPAAASLSARQNRHTKRTVEDACPYNHRVTLRLGKYSPSPLGKGDRRRRRRWMRCSCSPFRSAQITPVGRGLVSRRCFHFRSAKFEPCNNPSAPLFARQTKRTVEDACPYKTSRCHRQHFTPHSAAFHKIADFISRCEATFHRAFYALSPLRYTPSPRPTIYHVATGNISRRILRHFTKSSILFHVANGNISPRRQYRRRHPVSNFKGRERKILCPFCYTLKPDIISER